MTRSKALELFGTVQEVNKKKQLYTVFTSIDSMNHKFKIYFEKKQTIPEMFRKKIKFKLLYAKHWFIF